MKSVIATGLVALMTLPAMASAAESPVAATPTSNYCPSCQDLELSEIIARYAKRTGKQFIVDPRVRAQVTLAGMDPDKLTWDKLLAILTVHQFVAVQQGDWILVIPDANARQATTPVFTDRNFKAAAPDEVVTLVTAVKNICAAQAVPVLRPMMPQAAHMAAYTDTNTLILSDHAANVHRLVSLIEALERTGEKNSSSTGDCAARFDSKSK